MERLEVTADVVLQEIAKMAFFDARRLFNSDGSLKLISEIDDHSSASLASLEVRELFDGTGNQKHAYGLLRKVKLADKAKSLEMLGCYLKLFSLDRCVLRLQVGLEDANVKPLQILALHGIEALEDFSPTKFRLTR
jgi:hypothetical protein